MGGEGRTEGCSREMTKLEAQTLLLWAHFGTLSLLTPSFGDTTPCASQSASLPCNNYAALRDLGLQTKERICSLRSLSIAPTAIANITTSANPTRNRILSIPRMKCRSNPKLTPNLLFTRSTAVRPRYNRLHL